MKRTRIAAAISLLVAVGPLASQSASAKDSGLLFVSSEKDNAVLVVDAKTFEPVKSIATNARPRHLQFNADRTLIYAASGRGNSIDIIDVATLELVDRIADIEDPEAIDLSPDGKTMYISLEDDSALGILDLDAYFAGREETPALTVAEPEPESDGDDDDDDDDDDEDGDDEDGDDEDGDGQSVPGLSLVEVGGEPEGVLTHPDGEHTYVTSEVANVVHVINNAQREIVANIVVGDRPRRFALTPDGKEMWVTNELSGTTSIFDVATNKVVGEVEYLPRGFRKEDVTPVGITMTADGKTLIVGLGRANHVAFVDVASRKVEDYVLVGTRAWNTTLTRDEQTLYVVNGLSDDVSIIDMASRKVTKSFPVGRVPYGLLIDD